MTHRLLQFFEYGHLAEQQQTVSRECAALANYAVQNIKDGPELTAGLRKLLEAKDCFVRATLEVVE